VGTLPEIDEKVSCKKNTSSWSVRASISVSKLPEPPFPPPESTSVNFVLPEMEIDSPVPIPVV